MCCVNLKACAYTNDSVQCSDTTAVLIADSAVLRWISENLRPQGPLGDAQGCAAMLLRAMAEHNACKDRLRDAGVLPALVGLLHSPDFAMQTHACGVFEALASSGKRTCDLSSLIWLMRFCCREKSGDDIRVRRSEPAGAFAEQRRLGAHHGRQRAARAQFISYV